jgi:hypothetical protein
MVGIVAGSEALVYQWILNTRILCHNRRTKLTVSDERMLDHMQI